MIKPNLKVARTYIESAEDLILANSLVHDNPWLFDTNSIDFTKWGSNLLAHNGFGKDSSLHLVGSAATGFSLSPTKAGAQFRNVSDPPKPSDLDFALVDSEFFTNTWNDLVKEDSLLGSSIRPDAIRIRVYWGRIEQHVIPGNHRPRTRSLLDAIRRQQICRGHSASIRVYRRVDDLLGYSLWCIRQLKRELAI